MEDRNTTRLSSLRMNLSIRSIYFNDDGFIVNVDFFENIPKDMEPILDMVYTYNKSIKESTVTGHQEEKATT